MSVGRFAVPVIPTMETISIEQVRRLAPAAFSITPDSSLSASYSHVTTAKVLDALQQDGWLLTHAKQSPARFGSSSEHKRHEISLTHPDLPVHAEGAPVLRLANSSDGAHAFRLIGGFLRWACTNQLYAGVKVVGGVFYHRGGSLEDKIVAGARDARKNFDRVISTVDLWRSIQLDERDVEAFEATAMWARWPDQKSRMARGMLTPRRAGDAGNDLWAVFNRAQEAVIRGGFRVGVRREGSDVHDWRSVRRVTSIAATERINTQLWELAEGVARWKGATA